MSAAPQKNIDDNLYVRFERKPMKNEAKSLVENRPIFEEVDFIRIAVPGDQASIVSRPVWDDPNHPKSDVNRFGEIYRRWKSGQSQETVGGTPLETLAALNPPILPATMVEELKHFNVRTAEHLVSMPASNAQRFPGINQIIQKTAAFLEAAKADAPAAHMRGELEKKDSEIAALKQALKEQGDRLERLESGAKKSK